MDLSTFLKEKKSRVYSHEPRPFYLFVKPCHVGGLLLGTGGFYHVSNGLLSFARRHGFLLSLKAQKAQVAARLVVAAGIAVSLLTLGGVLFKVEGYLDSDYAPALAACS